MSSMLCGHLAPHVHEIAGSADRQSVRYVPSTWHSWLRLADLSSSVTERVFTAIGQSTVSRSQIRTLAKDADTADGRLALLIAVLVWGRGTANGRMRDPIVRALTHPDRDAVLERTARPAQRGESAAAYAACTLPGLRAPFFTKWLWAASSRTPTSCCLVQDKRVWNSLGALGWDSLVAAGTRDWAARYGALRLRDPRLRSHSRRGCERRGHRVHPVSHQREPRRIMTAAAPSVRNRLYQEFWGRFRARIAEAHPDWGAMTGSRSAPRSDVPTGTPHTSLTSRFSADEGLILQIVFKGSPAANTARFWALSAKKAQFERALGAGAVWDEMPGK